MSGGEHEGRYQPGGGYKSALDDRPSGREVLKYLLLGVALVAVQSLLARYVGHDTAGGIVDLCLGVLLVALGAWMLVFPERSIRSAPEQARPLRVIAVVLLIWGSVFATLSIQSLFFAE